MIQSTKRLARYYYLRAKRAGGTPKDKAKGVAWGCFLGFGIPTGFQLISLAGVSLLYRFNRILAIVFIYITSNFFTLPLVYFYQTLLGGYLLNYDLTQTFSDGEGDMVEMEFSFFINSGTEILVSFLLGGFIIGVSSALISYIVSYLYFMRESRVNLKVCAATGVFCASTLFVDATEQYTYHQQTKGEEPVTYIQEFSLTGSLWKVTTKQQGLFVETVSNSQGETISYYRKTDSEEIRTERKGDSLEVVFMKDGEREQKSIDIDDDSWMQQLSYGLRRFIRAGGNKKYFHIINPLNGKNYECKAVNEGQKTITVHGESRKVNAVTVSPTGFYSLFWDAEYFFDPMTLVLVKCNSVNGPPGTALTEITLTTSN